jgi:hypothetical protein
LEFTKIEFGEEAEKAVISFLDTRIESLKTTLNGLYNDKIVKWRKAYEAAPAEATRQFPFFNASNNVIPIIAIFTDTLTARIMSSILQTKPIWPTKFVGKHDGLDEKDREALEDYFEYIAIEPQELDLRRVYREWVSEFIQYGTSVLKANHEKDVIHSMQLDEATGKPDWIQEVVYEGPRVEKIRFEDFLISPSAKRIAPTEFMAHRLRLNKADMELRGDIKFYDSKLVDEIIQIPDDYGSATKQSQEESAGVSGSRSDESSEWIPYECHFQWKVKNKLTNVIIWYHARTKKILRAVYNPFVTPRFVAARLFPRPDMFHGYGFAETLWAFQEEISTTHNERLNNRAIANARLWRVSPDSPLVDSFRIYPSAILPADEGEIEAIQMGDISPQSIDDEKLSLELAERRCGVSPPMQGQGSGTQNKKGVYSAIGTLSIMQEGNRRTDMNINDVRHAHQMLGRVILDDNAMFGIREALLSQFGESAERIKKTIAAYKEKKLTLPVYSSSASVNKEVEKQNVLMLTQIVNRHYAAITQMIQMAANEMVPQQVRDYITHVSIPGADHIMRIALRAFDIEDFERLVPDDAAKFASGQQPAQGAIGAPGGAAGASPIPGGGPIGGLLPGPSNLPPAGAGDGAGATGNLPVAGPA